MKLFSKQKSRATTVQLRSGEKHPFGLLDSYVPLGSGETRLYRTIREAVPVVDAAIMKIIRLTGGFEARCGDKKAEKELNAFIRNDLSLASRVEPLEELIDFEKELARIAKEKANAEKQLAGIENKLSNQGFIAKAPEAVVNGAREDAAKLRALIEKLDASAAAMKK